MRYDAPPRGRGRAPGAAGGGALVRPPWSRFCRPDVADVLDDRASSGNGAQLAPEERAELHRVEPASGSKSLDYVLVGRRRMRHRAPRPARAARPPTRGCRPRSTVRDPLRQTKPASEQPEYPVHLALEKRARARTDGNATAMVVRANKGVHGIGGHISTYASAATRRGQASTTSSAGSMRALDPTRLHFQGHASPGVYARAYLERRFDSSSNACATSVANCRLCGLGSVLTPRRSSCPSFWQFPHRVDGAWPDPLDLPGTGPRYLEARALKPQGTGKVWVFLVTGRPTSPRPGRDQVRRPRAPRQPDWVINAARSASDRPVSGTAPPDPGELGPNFFPAVGNAIKVAWGSKWGRAARQGRRRRPRPALQPLESIGQSKNYVAFGGPELRQASLPIPRSLAKLIEGW